MTNFGCIRKTATLVEDLGGATRRYGLSEPWAGYDYVLVTADTLPGEPVHTRVYAAERQGPIVTSATGQFVLLQEYDEDLSFDVVLSRAGYALLND